MLARAARSAALVAQARAPAAAAVGVRGLAGPAGDKDEFHIDLPKNRAMTVTDETRFTGVRAQKANAVFSRRIRTRFRDPMPFHEQYRIQKARPLSVNSLRESAVLSGNLEHSTKHQVTIYKMGPITSLTEPRMAGRHWSIKFDHTTTWGSELMGWAASANPLRGLGRHLMFTSLPAAMAFCERAGWTNYVVEKPRRAWTDQSYNLIDHKTLPRRVESEMDERGARKSRTRWAHAGAGQSNWQNRRRSTYGSEEWKGVY
ncbi:hypothetical protein FNF27_05419 [Cafeteria roenbergensis]|uniref:NADH dehydrogenase [ubiquinone] iron-sulfur protein 4, mitochondrial n=1 Tax=Cafeteria roenbergensis TaxID=33653 RepID=A0A5A8C8H8_CAFRO|nr:hypothetical protein FNF29_05959 [Cafeteria roenbergensis]KAA0166084.1 hypothetical protein FNF28_03252 [Cafeteria roenbergensis]KAA0167149.1 hypothetical protein FNF31_01035 [Cafeteria roenbergensis]KAA0173070.1 hypothetical protein FNF27_05419 [Cafeteria roenbergensis]|eukprot:KAA0149406.1 hypothetical protein FNF29_05959 [Cafeteria roenbergensis]